jgi:cytochrome c553
MRKLAFYYASLPEPLSLPLPRDAMLAIERGEAIARRGIPSQRIPSCIACHGPGAIHRNPFYPQLAGQYADYLVLQLMLFKNADRGGTAYAYIMRAIADRLTPEQMRAVALYYASRTSALDRPVW